MPQRVFLGEQFFKLGWFLGVPNSGGLTTCFLSYLVKAQVSERVLVWREFFKVTMSSRKLRPSGNLFEKCVGLKGNCSKGTDNESRRGCDD